VTLSHSLTNREDIPAQVLEQLDNIFQNFPFISFNMINMMRLLLANQQGGVLDTMTVSPHQSSKHKSLSSIVIHTAVVLYSRPNVDMLLPFTNMLQNPQAIEVS